MNDLSNLDQIPSNIDDYENGGAAHPGHLVDSAPLEGGVNLDVEASQEISSVPKSRRGRRQKGKQADRDEKSMKKAEQDAAKDMLEVQPVSAATYLLHLEYTYSQIAVASLVLSLLAFLFFLVPLAMSIVAVSALVMGLVAKVKLEQSKIAFAGILISIAVILLLIAGLTLTILSDKGVFSVSYLEVLYQLFNGDLF